MASLPPELEKAIFETTAYSEPTFVPTLKLVAWRVNEWVSKYLYRILMLRGRETYSHDGWKDYPCDDDALFTRLKSIPPSVLRESVRHLYLEAMPLDMCLYLLLTCTAVEDLWINLSDSSLLDLVAAFPLRRLHCHPAYLFSAQEKLDFGHPLFSNVTHLELFIGSPSNEEFNPSSWTGLASIPHLTRLSFTEPVFLPLVPSLLQNCKLLRVLVFILDKDWMDADEASAVLSSTARGHLRFVQMECSAFGQDWRSGALGRGDYWDRAEAFVAKRMTKEIDRTSHYLLLHAQFS
ncbi:hypothetical protein FB45DRAFT_301938 [Roridomyces roridus]|uniref:Uncharacterized protein n=1 Tax=Roridomyces roridus TaxID=1738132 RepID=A0AAD7FCU9_9AGAR|nr:hypothetical protein FB45DRAFT_301938 [Roridomyces roridus]